MAVLKCPVCGSDAVDSNQQKATFSADTVVCHCAMSHRFLVSLREGVPSQSTSNQPVAFPLESKRPIRAA